MKGQIQFETNGLTVLAVRIPYEVTIYAISPDLVDGKRLDFLYMKEIDLAVQLPEGDWKCHCNYYH